MNDFAKAVVLLLITLSSLSVVAFSTLFSPCPLRLSRFLVESLGKTEEYSIYQVEGIIRHTYSTGSSDPINALDANVA